ncbi:alkaline phosphatase family protein [Azospirillum sp. B4]|uniref:alkaline phosphatase family protein n=1 Tax=Azospirillum sp. B4 TaxID=95605 RepID=UPI000678E89E|nr:alkaline phosphatase family protein [Azospirillum sp. B4]
MPTQVTLVNNLSDPLAVSTTVTPALDAYDWGITASTVAAMSDGGILWMNRDKGITNHKTWTFTTAFEVAGVPVTVRERVTGTLVASTLEIQVTAGGTASDWSGAGPVAVPFTGTDGQTYTVTGALIGEGLLSFANVVFSVARTVLPRIKHMVVLVMENRSLDNLLGWVYDPAHPPAGYVPPGSEAAYEGLLPQTYANSNPDITGGAPVYASAGTTAWTTNSGTISPYQVPTPDPGEQFFHVGGQVSNNMGGFLTDYVVQVGEAKHPLGNAAQIMQSYAPDQVPVISTLARAFALSDAWHASVPSQTYPNRAFMLAGSSAGNVNNTRIPWDIPTLFDVLESQGISWAVYNDSILPSLTKVIFLSKYATNEKNFGSIDDFGKALADGTLPTFTFLEPSFGPLEHDRSYHPPYDVRPGENFLAKIYTLIAESPHRDDTLFLLLFDEHGGTYDHVEPPQGAAPPAPDPVATDGSDFPFNRFGVRVPAVVMSSYTPRGVVFRSPTDVPYDHTSVLATVRDWLGLQSAFKTLLPSPRIAAAPTLAPLVAGDTPQPWPALDLADDGALLASLASIPADTPLNDIQRDVLLAAAAAIGGRLHTEEERAEARAHLCTLADAEAWLRPLLPFLRRPAG